MNIIGVPKGGEGQVSERRGRSFRSTGGRGAPTGRPRGLMTNWGITMTCEVSWQTAAVLLCCPRAAIRAMTSGCPIGPEPSPERPR